MSYNSHKRNIQVFLLFLGRILEPSRYIYLVAREKTALCGNSSYRETNSRLLHKAYSE